MEWIERFVTGLDGRLKVVARPLTFDDLGKTPGPSGELRVIDLGDLDTSVPRASKGILVRRSVELDLRTARLVDLRPYLDDCVQRQLSSEAQVGWLFGDNRSSVVVPAQAMLLGLLAPDAEIRNWVLRPCGPEHFAITVMDAGRLKPERGLQVGQTQLLYRRRPQALAEWLHSYAGARAAWTSAYSSALRGQLSLKLPSAQLTCAVVGPTIGRTLVAFHLTVHSLETDEVPSQIAPMAPRSYVFSEYAKGHPGMRSHGKAGPPRSDVRVRELGLLGGLSDAQWELVWPCIADSVSRAKKRFNETTTPRRVVDAILHKLGTPCRWERCADEFTAWSASTSFRFWRKTGVWEKVMAALGAGEQAQ